MPEMLDESEIIRKDLDDSIAAEAKIVSSTPDDHPRKPDYLCDLGNSLSVRFDYLGELKDLEESVNVMARELTP
jgi:hypothetical protein